MISIPMLKMLRGALLALALNVSPALAEDLPVDEAAQAEGRRLMEEAFAANKAGDEDRARRLYLESFETYPSYDVAGNLGMVELALQRYLEAAEHLEYCLRNFPTGESRELKQLVRNGLQEARKFVGGVKIEVSEPGAEVTLDGQSVGKSPIEREIFVMAGEHTVRAEGRGGAAEKTITAEKTETAQVQLELKPVVASGLDDETSSASGEDSETPHFGGPNDETDVRTKRNWVPAYILGGVTVAALGTSMVFRGLAGGKKKDIDELQLDDPSACSGSATSECSELGDAIDTHKTYATVSHATLIGGAVFAAATIGYVTYVLVKKDSPVQAGMAVDHTGGLLTLSGSF